MENVQENTRKTCLFLTVSQPDVFAIIVKYYQPFQFSMFSYSCSVCSRCYYFFIYSCSVCLSNTAHFSMFKQLFSMLGLFPSNTFQLFLLTTSVLSTGGTQSDIMNYEIGLKFLLISDIRPNLRLIMYISRSKSAYMSVSPSCSSPYPYPHLFLWSCNISLNKNMSRNMISDIEYQIAPLLG